MRSRERLTNKKENKCKRKWKLRELKKRLEERLS
jgi:hypothetical protein